MAQAGWDWYGDASVVVIDLPLACCGIEVEAAVPPDAVPVAWDAAADHRIVTISGTATTAVAPALTQTVARLRELGPVTVVAFGACTAAGGPYWDSYSVLKGIDQAFEVDQFLPGCPPNPTALTDLVDHVRAELADTRSDRG